MSITAHKEFCLWLEGFFMRGGETPTAEQWHAIGKRLQKVMNPEQSIQAGREITMSIEDYINKYGQQDSVKPPLTSEKLGEMQRETRTVGFRKPNLDECSQGEQKRNEDTPIKTIADLARESMSKDITPSAVMKDFERQVRNLTSIPFHTPQEPFKSEGY